MTVIPHTDAGDIKVFHLTGKQVYLTVKFLDMLQDMSVRLNTMSGLTFPMAYGKPSIGWKVDPSYEGEPDLFFWLKKHGIDLSWNDVMDTIIHIWLDRYWPPEKGEALARIQAEQLNAKMAENQYTDSYPHLSGDHNALEDQ